jgi:uncharacterized membrane protein
VLGQLLYSLHVLGAVLWVGGMAFALFALRPALAGLDPPARLAVHEGALRRFFLVVWHAMPALLLTGGALMFFWYGGFRSSGWHVHFMLATGLIMAAVFAALFFGPFRAFRAARERGDLRAAAAGADKVRRLVTVNFALGLLTVAVAAWGRFGGQE